MIVFPNVKINLGLFITGKRPDGFHNIESVFYPVFWKEALELTDRVAGAEQHEQLQAVAENVNVRFLQYGIPIPGDAAENLCIKVHQALEEWFNLPAVDMHLLKTLPIGAGLGGGSADAAFALRAFKDFYNLTISDVEAMELLAQLGSDCPFFWKNKPMFVHGRGEKMRPLALDLSDYHILLINPGLHISTKEAYAGIQPKDPLIDLNLITSLPIADWKEAVVNDFEGSVFVNHPLLATLKQQLYQAGALYASMTGSGSTLYGIFKEKPEVIDAWQNFTTWSGKLTL